MGKRQKAAGREARLAVQLHPDRGDLTQRGNAQQVRDDLSRLLETFDRAHGGSWLYLEIDPGFKWETVEALVDFAQHLRNSTGVPTARCGCG